MHFFVQAAELRDILPRSRGSGSPRFRLIDFPSKPLRFIAKLQLLVPATCGTQERSGKNDRE
jgi:hypothetical protein